MARRIIFKQDGLSNTDSPKEGFFYVGFDNTTFSQKDSNGNLDPISSGSTSSFILPENYGAIGDGVTDDTTSLQNAFNDASSFNSPIYLSNIYYVSSKIDATNTVVFSNPSSKIVSNTTDFVLSAEGSRSLRYNTTVDVLRGYSNLFIDPAVLVVLNFKQGDLIKIMSDRKFNLGSGENGLQGEIQRVYEVDNLTGEVKIYGWFEDTYLISDGACISKITSGKFETIGTLTIEQGGLNSSKGINLDYLDTPKVDVKITNAIERSLNISDCYSPKVHVNNYGANLVGLGYGIAIGNSTMYGEFSGTCESNRHSITFGTNTERGVGWGNKIVNFTGKSHNAASIFDSHATCGSVYFYNCNAIGGSNRHGATVSSGFPYGFSIEGRTTHIVNCTVKDCYGAASSGNYNNIQEIYVKGLNCDECTIGFSAVGTEVERLVIEDIDMYNSSFDANSICVNLGGLSSSTVTIKNIKSYNVRCGVNLSGNELVGGQKEFVIEGLKTIYATPSTSIPTAYYSALRLYDANPVSLINCETNAPRLLTTNDGLNLKRLEIHNSTSYDSYGTPIVITSPVENLTIQNCFLTASQVSGYFLQANAGSNITNFKFIGNTVIGVDDELRGCYIHPSNDFVNFFESGNTLNITVPTSISSSSKQPDYWITEGNIYQPLKLKGTGTPEGGVTASIGTIFIRTDGGTGTTMYLKESGTGNTGWVAK
jgi:hypothetical protein